MPNVDQTYQMHLKQDISHFVTHDISFASVCPRKRPSIFSVSLRLANVFCIFLWLEVFSTIFYIRFLTSRLRGSPAKKLGCFGPETVECGTVARNAISSAALATSTKPFVHQPYINMSHMINMFKIEKS
jgi:hypothetical protein